MSCLLDTGILLRLVNRNDDLHGVVEQSLEILRGQHVELFIATQNVAEYWSVATRPADQNDLGYDSKSALDYLESVIEPICGRLGEHESTYSTFKNLGRKYLFGGKQVHDARLMATMLSWDIDSILTLNPQHFARFAAEGLHVLTVPIRPA